jgi:hypothetical protein
LQYLAGAGGKDYLEPMQDMTVLFLKGQFEDVTILQSIAHDADPVARLQEATRLVPMEEV